MEAADESFKTAIINSLDMSFAVKVHCRSYEDENDETKREGQRQDCLILPCNRFVQVAYWNS